MAGRTIVSKIPSLFLSRSVASRSHSIDRLRPLLSLADPLRLPIASLGDGSSRCFSTRPTTSSLNDPSPNWSNRPPKETILLDGCDFEHWLVVVEPPDPNLTRDEIIDSYIKTLAQVLGSEEEAKKSIYSVSTKHYFAFGCIVSEELSYKIKTLPKVRWVLPDSYLDVKNKDYGGEPFIDGKAVPYDPKYHEEWVRNNARANERSRRNDRPRNFDRSRNFERRRENMQNRDFQSRDVSPMPNQGFQNREGQNPMPPQNAVPNMPNRDFNPMPPRDNNMSMGSAMPNRDVSPLPPPSSPPPSNVEYTSRDTGAIPNRGYQNQMPNPGMPGGPGYQGGGPGYQGGNPGGVPSGPGYQGGSPGYQGGGQGYQGGNPGGSVPSGAGYQGGSPGYQGGGQGYQGGNPGGSVPSGPGYQGGNPGYQGGGQGYQGGNPGGNLPSGPGYQGGSPGYQGGGQGYQGGNPGYQGGTSNYQGGGGPGYQGGSPSYQTGGPTFHGSSATSQSTGSTYQGRDIPGRDD